MTRVLRPRATRPAVVALTATLALALGATACASTPRPHAETAETAEPAAATASPAPQQLTGYAMVGSATAGSITRDGDLLQTIGVDGVNLTGPAGLSKLDPEAETLRQAADDAGKSPVLLMSNYSESLGDFDERLAYRMLSQPEHRAAVVKALVHRAAGFDGVQIDLESLAARDRAGLVAFTRAVRDALPGKSVSMAFMASSNGRGYAARGYALGRLVPLLDVAVLMSYDQHGPWSGPGPISSLPWLRRQLRYLLTRVPAAKLDLGAAAYGYQWGGGRDQLTVAGARKLAGSKARWSTTHGEWHARITTKRVIWWDDARSVRVRRQIATAHGLHGVAIWEIGASGKLAP